MTNAAREYLPPYDYFHPNFRRIRAEARTRARGICRGCGLGPAEQAHHPAWRYPPAATITADQIVLFCRICHRVVTMLRGFLSVGGGPGSVPFYLRGGPRDGR